MLSPLLILTGLADSKQAGAAASVFILLNPISGFLANSISKPIDISLLIPLAIAILFAFFHLFDKLSPSLVHCGTFNTNMDKNERSLVEDVSLDTEPFIANKMS